MPQLAQITLYPIKSLDGVAVEAATVLESGALKGDREFAIMDYQGKFVNGKRVAAVHQVRSQFNLHGRTVTLGVQGQSETYLFHLDRERMSIERWLGNYFQFPVKLIQNTEMGFPDDTASPGPTVISTATLETVSSWFPGLTIDNLRRRLRTTLEITDAEPFWEEQLYTLAGRFVPFRVGSVQLMGVNPCQRCIVPTRDAETGATYPDWKKIFLSNRQTSLPAWAERSRFNHFYRLALNTRISPDQASKVLRVGDPITLA